MKTDQVTYDQTTSCTLAWAPAWALTWALVWEPLYGMRAQRKPTFMGTLVCTCVSTRVSTCGSPFVGALVGHFSLSPALCFTETNTQLIRNQCCNAKKQLANSFDDSYEIWCPHGMLCYIARNYITKGIIRNQLCDVSNYYIIRGNSLSFLSSFFISLFCPSGNFKFLVFLSVEPFFSKNFGVWRGYNRFGGFCNRKTRQKERVNSKQ